MTARRRIHGRSRGVALVNALIIVAALAAIATVLLTRAQGVIDRLEGERNAAQAALYLDAAEALVAQVLAGADPPHHSRQGWAQPRRDEPIDRGQVDWQVVDLQGRFNLNWLTDNAEGEDWDAAAALQRLLLALDLPADSHLADALSADERRRQTAFAGTAQAPPPLPLVLVRQLKGLPGLDAENWRLLAPHLTALPANSALNVNSALRPVLNAVLPMLDENALDAIEARRRERPFRDNEDFTAWVEETLDIVLIPEGGEGEEATDETVVLPPLTGDSDWFEARLQARLDSLALRRTVVLHRDRPGAAARIHLAWHESD